MSPHGEALPRYASKRGPWGPKTLKNLRLQQPHSRWKGLSSIARVIHTSEAEGQTHIEKRFYISSLPAEKPSDILHTVRSHWQIESCLHWSLDVTFREDDCRIRDENAALNMSWLRKFALGLLKNEKSFKIASIRRKQLKVWASPDYLTKILKQS